MGLIFAGHETTAGQASWVVALLLQNPDYLKLVQDEIRANVTYGGAIDAAVLANLSISTGQSMKPRGCALPPIRKFVLSRSPSPSATTAFPLVGA